MAVGWRQEVTPKIVNHTSVSLRPHHLENLEKIQTLQAYTSPEALGQWPPAASSLVYFP